MSEFEVCYVIVLLLQPLLDIVIYATKLTGAIGAQVSLTTLSLILSNIFQWDTCVEDTQWHLH